MTPKPPYTFDNLVAIMARLRGPGGCPWDAEQTHQSLKRYLIEESYEVVEAIDNNDSVHLKEELGDLLLQPIFHAAIAVERREFDIYDVIAGICEKLIRRHPHVFGDMEIRDSKSQVENWEKIKKAEKKDAAKSVLDGIPPHLPGLLAAQKITEKAARVGFDWENPNQVSEKVGEELKELDESMASGDKVRIEEELGDVFFALVNLGRFLSIDSEEALRKATGRFRRRFSHIEETLRGEGVSLQNATLERMEQLWAEAKQLERQPKLP